MGRGGVRVALEHYVSRTVFCQFLPVQLYSSIVWNHECRRDDRRFHRSQAVADDGYVAIELLLRI